MHLDPLFNRPPYHDPNPATMFIVSLVPLPCAPMHPVCNPNPLIQVDIQTRRLRFFVIYVPFFTDSGFRFKALARQMGEDGKKIEGGRMIDFVVSDIFTGKTIDRISSFFEKWILVDSGLGYTYQGHVNVNEDSINIAKWVSWFDDIKEIVQLNSTGLDGVIASVCTGAAQMSTLGSNSEPNPEQGAISGPALCHFPGKNTQLSRPAFNSFTSGKGFVMPPLKSPSLYISNKRGGETFNGASSFKKALTVSPVSPVKHTSPITRDNAATAVNHLFLANPVHLNSVQLAPLKSSKPVEPAKPVNDGISTSNNKHTCISVSDLSSSTVQAVDSLADDLSGGLPFLSSSWIDEHSDVWDKL
jgi:hypothetical protein